MLGQHMAIYCTYSCFTLRQTSKEYQLAQKDCTTLHVCIITHTGRSFTGDKLRAALELHSVKLICQDNNEWTCTSVVWLHGDVCIFTFVSFLP